MSAMSGKPEGEKHGGKDTQSKLSHYTIHFLTGKSNTVALLFPLRHLTPSLAWRGLEEHVTKANCSQGRGASLRRQDVSEILRKMSSLGRQICGREE